MVLECAISKDEVCINGKFVYTTQQKAMEACREKSEAYIDSARSLGARFFAEGPQADVGANDAQHKAIFPNLGVLLSIIVRRKWNFSVTDVSRGS